MALNFRSYIEFVAACGILGCLSLSGCGASAYEERLANTSDFYSYLQVIDTNLASTAWERKDLGMTMRVPLPFQSPLAGPEKMEDDDGNVYWGEDPRHPHVLGIDLEGLVEAWQTTLPDENNELVDTRLYVVSNHSRWLLKDEGGAPPQSFMSDLRYQLMNAFQVVIPEGEVTTPIDNAAFRQLIPEPRSNNAKYKTPKDFTAIRMVPENTVGGQNLQGLLYEHTAGDIQMAVLVLCPKSITPQFRNRIELALQTLEVNGQAPKTAGGPGSSGTPGSGQSGASGAF